MLRGTRAQAILVAVALMDFVSIGCKREQTVTVTGSVVRNGQPIPLGPTGVLEVKLRPDVGEDEPYTDSLGRCEKDGSFSIPNVRPGRYKVGVEQFDPTPQMDKLNGAFRADTGKIVREIDGKAPLTIDLAKPSGG
jgi:hypothetical protein